ncbi:unnamed protein product [Pylaiella littoralis]
MKAAEGGSPSSPSSSASSCRGFGVVAGAGKGGAATTPTADAAATDAAATAGATSRSGSLTLDEDAAAVAAAVSAASNGSENEELEGTRRAATVGWGENNDQTGPGSIKDRLGAFSTDSDDRAQAGAGRVVGSGASAGEVASPSPEGRGGGGSVHDSVPDVPSVTDRSRGAGGRSVSAGGKENKVKKGFLGSIKHRLGAFSSDSKTKDTKAATSASAAATSRRETGGKWNPSHSDAGAEAVVAQGESAGRVGMLGSAETNGQKAPGSIRDFADAAYGDKAAASAAAAKEEEAARKAGAVVGRLPRGDVAGAAAEGSEDAASTGSERSVGRVGKLGWGKSSDKSPPGSFQDRADAAHGSETAAAPEEEGAAAGKNMAEFGRLPRGDVHAAVAESSEAALAGAGNSEQTTGRVGTAGWGESNDQTGPGSIKDRISAFTPGDKDAQGEPGSVAGDETFSARGSISPPYQGRGGGNVHDSVPDIPPVSGRSSGGGGGRLGSSGGREGSGKKVPRGSIKDRLGAFSSEGKATDAEPATAASASKQKPGGKWSRSPPRAGPEAEGEVQQTGTTAGENNDQSSSVSVEGPANSSRGGGGKTATAEGEGGGRVGAAGSSRQAMAHGDAAEGSEPVGADAGSEHIVVRAGTLVGWGDNKDQVGPGSIKDRANALLGSKAAEEEGAASGATGKPATVVGRLPRDGVRGAAKKEGSEDAASAASERSIGRVGTHGWGEDKVRSPPGSLKDRATAAFGGSKTAEAAAGGELDDVSRRRPPAHQTGGGSGRASGGGLHRTHSSSSSVGSDALRSPPPGGGVRGAAGGGGGGSRRSGSAGGGSTPSPPKRKSSMTREEAIAALADAEAAAAREDKQWAIKVKALEEERRKAREERQQLAVEAAEAAGLPPPFPINVGDSGVTATGAGVKKPVDVRGHTLQLDEDAKSRAVDATDKTREAPTADGSSSSSSSRRRWSSTDASGDREAVPPMARTASGGVSGGGGGARKPKKRSMKKSGFPLTGGLDNGSASKDKGGDRADSVVKPWPEAALASVGADEDGDGMEAKKPINGWDAGDGMAPWRSPERAPEYGGNDNSPRKSDMFVKSASFTGDPTKARNSPWGESGDRKPAITERAFSASDQVGQEDADVSWSANSKDGADDAADRPKKGEGDVILESMLFKDDAKEIGVVEARHTALRVMSLNTSEDKKGKPARRAPTWTQYYFRLREQTLTKSAPRRSSFPGSADVKAEEMKLTSYTMTSYTNTKNCFCVRTGETSWFLLSRSLDDMKRWMAAINLRTRHIFQKEHGVHDDYMGQGRRGRFFYRMVAGSTPQWILTHPMSNAPRTGDGLFPGEVIDVTQVLSSDGLSFLRLANDRGWTYGRSPADGSVLFEDLAGGVSEDKEEYTFPSGASGMVPILHGPGLKTQATGVMLRPGESARASERFTPLDNTRVVFVKLADGRGWIPVKSDSRGPSTVLRGW